MPLIVYAKTMKLRVCWAQIRRIKCGECPATFAYIASGTEATGATGLPVISSDDAMRRTVGRRIEAKLNRIAGAPRRGVARCAACRHPQPWMLPNWFVERIPGILLTLVLLAPFPVIAGFAFAGNSNRYLAFSWWGFAFTCLLALAAITAFGCLRVWMQLGAAEGPNPRAMRDNELRDFLADCAARGLDPALTWWWGRVRRKSPPQDLAIQAIPFLDQAGGFEAGGPPPVPGE